jgi:hypothetical protein
MAITRIQKLILEDTNYDLADMLEPIQPNTEMVYPFVDQFGRPELLEFTKGLAPAQPNITPLIIPTEDILQNLNIFGEVARFHENTNWFLKLQEVLPKIEKQKQKFFSWWKMSICAMDFFQRHQKIEMNLGWNIFDFYGES